MKVFSPEQTRKWDQYTIEHEAVKSHQLMERAASRAAEWILNQYGSSCHYAIFCGSGNNGGDGLVISRLLWHEGAKVDCYLLHTGASPSADHRFHLDQLIREGGRVLQIDHENSFPVLSKDTITIDALWGSGLSRPLEGVGAMLVEHLNNQQAQIIAIDLPSGLMPVTSLAIKATHTLSFQTFKLPFFYAENDPYTGNIQILDIGLHLAYEKETTADFETTGYEEAFALLRPRPKSSHKGSFGHAALLAGSWGMLGAAMLTAKASLRSGVGKLSCLVSDKCYPLLQMAVPEAIFRIVTGEAYPTSLSKASGFSALGIGPGWGLHEDMVELLRRCLSSGIPLILDADALNLLSLHKDLLASIPENSILTPHPKEFDLLTRQHFHSHERAQTAMKMAMEWKSIVVLKGHHTLVATPSGIGYFNLSGNDGMATAGSGDVLTGLITGLRAQGYGAAEAARLGVWLHGYAGDLTALKWGHEAMLAGDIVEQIGNAYQFLK
jgi:ADP-dependent NAD(P)H-hydrate dehydratase / NAD(P)H-hydrate epimerase